MQPMPPAPPTGPGAPPPACSSAGDAAQAQATPGLAAGAAVLPLRLGPGLDIRPHLEALAATPGGPAGFVLCGIGSVLAPCIRFADAAEGMVLPGPWEVVSLAGTLTADGAHLHVVVADAQGRVVGGHLCAGTRVRTTLELLIAPTPGWHLGRAWDAATGYAELTVQRAGPSAPGPGPATAAPPDSP